MLKSIIIITTLGIVLQIPMIFSGLALLFHYHGTDSGFSAMVLLRIFLVCCLGAIAGIILVVIAFIMMKYSKEETKSISWVSIPFKIDITILAISLVALMLIWR